MGEVTRMLAELPARPEVFEDLVVLVYDELRRLAARQLREERAGHTLQPTALVHEACMRLLGSTGPAWSGRAHFFRVAAEAMRRVLVDHARRRLATKRQAGPEVLEAAGGAEAAPSPELIVAVDDALQRLESEDALAAQVVRLRFFGGLEMAEVAQAAGISERAAYREWAFAKARLQILLDADPGGDVRGS
jgi:RNA polymerase sigma-70 factor (ECF subfamily)